MRKIQCVFVFLLLSATSAYSQGAVSGQLGNLRDMYGAPVSTINYSNTKGSPFLLDEWAMGTVKLLRGDSFKDIALKYEIVNDMLIFKDPISGQSLGFKDAVQEFTIIDNTDSPHRELLFRRGFGPNSNQFFQVLEEGGVQLIKRNSKIVKESREFNSASTTKAFYSVFDYYIIKGGEMIRIRKFKNDILANLDKHDQLEAFIKRSNLGFKSEEDLIKVIVHYNSL